MWPRSRSFLFGGVTILYNIMRTGVLSCFVLCFVLEGNLLRILQAAQAGGLCIISYRNGSLSWVFRASVCLFFSLFFLYSPIRNGMNHSTRERAPQVRGTGRTARVSQVESSSRDRHNGTRLGAYKFRDSGAGGDGCCVPLALASFK